MKTGWLNKRIIYHDLLAISLAGIVSLLFTQGVCQFLNVSSKKQYQCCNHSLVDSENSNIESVDSQNGTGPVSMPDDYFIIPATFSLSQFRIIKNIFQREENRKVVNESITKTLNNCYSLPPFWNPSIPIAHRKLII